MLINELIRAYRRFLISRVPAKRKLHRGFMATPFMPLMRFMDMGPAAGILVRAERAVQ